ncbi:MAG: YdeI/OmpD-associated family protein [Cyclobacteriaceae bacterium]
MDSFESIVSRFEANPLWSFHLPVPSEIAIKYIEGDNRRIICQLSEEVIWHCALMPSPKSQGGWFILLNKETRTKLGLKQDDKIIVTISKDKSKFGFELPAEFEELMNQDDEGKQHFLALTSGKQRSLVYIVQKVKAPNSRLNKSLAIFHHLKEMKGALDFKILNETIKSFNNR